MGNGSWGRGMGRERQMKASLTNCNSLASPLSRSDALAIFSTGSFSNVTSGSRPLRRRRLSLETGSMKLCHMSRRTWSYLSRMASEARPERMPIRQS